MLGFVGLIAVLFVIAVFIIGKIGLAPGVNAIRAPGLAIGCKAEAEIAADGDAAEGKPG